MVNRDNSVFFSKAGFLKFWIFSTVILTHSLNYEAYGLDKAPGFAAAFLYSLQLFELYLSGVVMPTYIIISGYGFMLGYTPDKTLAKWKKRFRSLFIPWLLWNTVMWLMSIAMESIPFIAQRLNSGFGFELTLRSWIVDGLLLPANGPFWFISNIMVGMLCAPAIYYIVANKFVGLAAMAAMLLGVYFTNASRYSILITLLFFTEAAWWARHYSCLVNRHYGPKARLAALAVLMVYLALGCRDSVQGGGILHALTFSVTTPALWIVTGDAKLGEVPKKLETYRFWIYGSHYLPLECIEKLWLMIGGASVAAAWIGWPLCCLLCVGLLGGAGWLVRRYMWPVWCLFCGIDPKKKPAG